MLFCFGLSLALYAVAYNRALVRNGVIHVQRKVMLRTLLYPLNFIVTYGLTFYLMWNPYHVLREMKWFACAADTMEGLNGFLNTGTYFIQSRQWRQQHRGAMVASVGRRSRESSQRGSFHACFDPTAVVILIPSTQGDERCRSPYISDIYRSPLRPIVHDDSDPTPKSP